MNLFNKKDKVKTKMLNNKEMWDKYIRLLESFCEENNLELTSFEKSYTGVKWDEEKKKMAFKLEFIANREVIIDEASY